MDNRIEGSFVAIITPMKEDLSVDYEGFKKLIDFHLEHGTRGLVPCGTTGESATMSHDTHREIIKFFMDHVKDNATRFGREFGKDIIVMPGTGSNATIEAVELTRHAQRAGAHAALVISPYYNKPTQEGLKLHFKTIAEAVDIPIVLYNVPGRTGKNVEASTTVHLAKQHENIVGIKEASGDLGQVMRIIKDTRGTPFSVMSGDDALTYPMMALGARGVISVAANIVPDKMTRLVNAMLAGDFTTGLNVHYELLDFFDACFYETNPGPVKYMASLMGLPSGGLRPPMVLPMPQTQERIKGVMRAMGLI